MTRPAGTIDGARGRTESERSLIRLADGFGLASQLLRSGSRERAMHLVVERSHAELRVPIACWIPPDGGELLVLAGFEGPRRAQVRRAIGGLPALPSQAVGEVRRSLEPVVGVRPVVIRAGRALLVAAGPVSQAGARLLESLGRLLGDALETLDVVSEARSKSEALDLGIAWTAHELRGPLIAAIAAIDQAVAMGAPEGPSELLRLTRVELEGLASLVDPLLRWTTGAEPLHRRGTDLVTVVRDAIASSELELAEERVALFAPASLELWADPRQLRTAVDNLLRNAVAFSPPGDPVIVEVGSRSPLAWVSIRDRGPGVPPQERDVIFEPFARGSAKEGRPGGGAGLGLFIARRVAEAHGGTVRLLPTRSGAAFSLEIPVDDGGRVRSAS